jgi:prophage maintenance system killer protein
VPPATEPGGDNLRAIYAAGVAAINDGIESAFEQAVVYCLFACRNQFYFDGNKRTSRAMMNGHLLSHGIDAISVPAASRLEYNTSMTDFSQGADGTRVIAFFASCMQVVR